MQLVAQLDRMLTVETDEVGEAMCGQCEFGKCDVIARSRTTSPIIAGDGPCQPIERHARLGPCHVRHCAEPARLLVPRTVDAAGTCEELGAQGIRRVAFAFGLLHGLGFASALIDIGLPQRDVPLALFAFNFGVELGQLAFIAVVLGIVRIALLLPLPAPAGPRLRGAASYAIGSVAAFWFIERMAGFWV